MTGIRRRDTTRVVGCPITRAGLIPMLRPFVPLNFLLMSSRVASEIGFSPSMKRDVMRGMSSITAPILIPAPRMYGILSTTSFQLSHERAPMMIPTRIPRKRGSPRRPNFFFIPSASISSLSIPGILSRPLLMTSAKGTSPAQNG